ncbi:FecCD family ABC transporter permease [Thermodesulforhabdus norvegica]|uniref:Iron complex transport system permease protein n=1 Tax=Thermodesulforhabdus norvegica TaxID=39841 RepID=A0A1I4UXM1_9BACT|nr:iron ABC transporter permease [Thermodesulforhabdus norvegica]SFM93777.1 iron complex transport system permease protein [Thermodesulforhabdus norvegica]
MEYIRKSPVELYVESRQRKRVLFFCLLLLVFFLALLALCKGNYEISLKRIIGVLTGSVGGSERVVLWNVRLPRIVAAIGVGTGLALSGACVQTLLRNPLASPSTLGISQGAAFGAYFSIIVAKGSVFSVGLSAFTGALSAMAIILLLGRIRGLTPEAIILSGIALSSLYGAGTVLLQYITDETQLARAVAWSFGDVGRSGWGEIFWVCLATSVAFGFIYSHAWKLNAFEAGDDTAKSLGVNVNSLRWQGIVAASLVTALATAFHGVIAFVGLVSPHIARRICGSDHRHIIPLSAVVGGLLLLGADTFSRLVIGSGSFPVGITTSFLGAPLFIYLLVRGKR